jgi:CBS domain-containing protein
MNAGEICNQEVVVCDGAATVLEAAVLMREHHVGDVVVVEDRPFGQVPIGILTDRDVAVGVVAKRLDPGSIRVAEVLVGELVTAQRDDDLLSVLEKMRVHGIRRLPVVDERGHLLGIVTFDDVVDLLAQVTDSLAAVAGTQPFFEVRARG